MPTIAIGSDLRSYCVSIAVSPCNCREEKTIDATKGKEMLSGEAFKSMSYQHVEGH